MQDPAGRALVALMGLTVIGVAVHHWRKGRRAGFLADLRGTPAPWVVLAGRLGYAAKAGALAVAGGLLVAAAAGYRAGRPQVWMRRSD